MDERLKRFVHCDPRFLPYLEATLQRLPPEIQDQVLTDPGLQILGSEHMSEECSLFCGFPQPVEYLVLLNMKSLNEPEHRLGFRMARELAGYFAMKQGLDGHSDDHKNTVLEKWGFQAEVASLRHCRAVQGSRGYKSGYEWAKRQSPGYLEQHFGLFYEEWNSKGLRHLPADKLAMVHRDTPRETLAGEETTGAVPLDEAMMEGVMVAMKETARQ
jgi:hypothetical protein